MPDTQKAPEGRPTRKAPKIRPIMVHANWHCRRGGGLVVGPRLSFPQRTQFIDHTVRTCVNFSFGFLCFTVGIDFIGRPIEQEARKDDTVY